MSGQNKIQKMKDIAEDVNIAMLVTIANDGEIRSRPMATQQIDEDGTIYFFTDNYSEKVKEAINENDVNVAYSCPEKNSYLSVSGKASISKDRAKIEELWSPIAKAWFPEGKDSDKLAIMKVKPTTAEYWDSSSSKLVTLFKMGKAVLTGTEFNDKDGNNKNINFS